MTFIWSWLRPCTIKNKQAKKHLTADSYSSRENWDFIKISNIRFPTTYHKVSSKNHSNELGIIALLLQMPLVRFLLTELSLRAPSNGYFYDMINYVLEPLAILEIWRYNQKNLYIIWYIKKKIYIY